MRLIDGIKLKGAPVEIPDCSRDDLPELFVQRGYWIGAEIGVGKAKFSQKLCQAGLKLYAIDPWQYIEGYKTSWSQEQWDAVYEQAKKNLALYRDCTIIRKTSMEAVQDFADESLDFVYIDGNHRFRYVAEDLCQWTKKVRKGGVIAGHDYTYFVTRSPTGVCHVIPVLNAYTQAYGIDNWYILGQKQAPEGEVRDKWRSWMWIKK